MSKPKIYKTTKSEFEIFKKEVFKWQSYFGLINWQIYVLHEKIDSFGNCMVDIPGKVSSIRLNTELSEADYIVRDIRRTAFHEVCELMLWPLGNQACGMYPHKFVDEATHDIIRRLEHTIFLNIKPGVV